jgi:hypothetical protein
MGVCAVLVNTRYAKETSHHPDAGGGDGGDRTCANLCPIATRLWRTAQHPIGPMKLLPFVQVDTTLFSASQESILAERGVPARQCRNGIGLNELDYGDVVFRFQDNGRLEEITMQAPVVYFGANDVPFSALESFVRSQDESVFDRVGFVVSPKFGLAFDPNYPFWVTALAAHCIDAWRAI